MYPMQPLLKKERCNFKRPPCSRAHGLAAASSLSALGILAPRAGWVCAGGGAVGLVETVLAVVAATGGVAADDCSAMLVCSAAVLGCSGAWAALVRLVRLANILFARRYRFLDPSPAPAVEGLLMCRSPRPDSLASCLRIAIRSWTGAWRVARIRWMRE